MVIGIESDKLSSLIANKEQEQYKQRFTKDKVNSFTLVVKDISKIFDSQAGRIVALDDINFAVKKGEFVSIVGPSGSGKTTLLNIIGGLDKPSLGKVLINNIDIFSQKDSKIAEMRNNMIGFVFQSYNLINRMTVQENVEFPGILKGNTDNVNWRPIIINGIHSRSRALLDVLGIGDKYKLKPSTLSGGQQQRVAIARALINNPTILFADEPIGNLDTRTGQDVFDLFKMISKKYETTIVMVTHNLELASQTDRSIYLKDGIIEKEIINK